WNRCRSVDLHSQGVLLAIPLMPEGLASFSTGDGGVSFIPIPAGCRVLRGFPAGWADHRNVARLCGQGRSPWDRGLLLPPNQRHDQEETHVDTTVILDPVDQLAMEMRGVLIRPGDPGYDDARMVRNGLIDRHPAVIARC